MFAKSDLFQFIPFMTFLLLFSTIVIFWHC